jgi:putative acetyltransferase
MKLAIGPEDPRRDDVRTLLEVHLAFAAEVTPPGHVHALGIEGLLVSEVTFFSARREGVLLGVGAIKQLHEFHVELKSMHTSEAARSQGVGRALVDHLVGVAVDRGCERVSLETGTMDAFGPARALYRNVGFRPCEPFEGYSANPNSVCMMLNLDPSRPTRDES